MAPVLNVDPHGLILQMAELLKQALPYVIDGITADPSEARTLGRDLHPKVIERRIRGMLAQVSDGRLGPAPEGAGNARHGSAAPAQHAAQRFCRADILVLVDAAIRGASPDPAEEYAIEPDFCLSQDLAFDGRAVLRTFELLEEALGITLPSSLAVDLALTSPTVGRLVRMLAHELENHHV